MNHACPHCGVNLRFKGPIRHPCPGERKFLPSRTYFLCRDCETVIVANGHPAESSKVLWLSVLIVCAMLQPEFWQWIPATAKNTVAVGLSLIFAVYAVYFCWQFHSKTNTWPRWRVASDQELQQLN
jgi:hypothetical protein